MTPRATARLAWTRQVLADPTVELEPASADASFRSYWRTLGHRPSRIVMDAPPGNEDLGPWLDVVERLCAAGLHAPQVFARDLEQGFLLLADLGRDLLLPALNAGSVEHLYRLVLDQLLAMQTRVDTRGLPPYDESRLVAEMELMPTWFLQQHLGYTIACEEWDVIELAFRTLASEALVQPQVFVHRDFHSRNLLLDGDEIGIIDFQDAVRGPITYDLVSLLRDCYIAWPDARVYDWVEHYRQRLQQAGLTDADPARFRQWFDLIGLQRHLKVLGIFCRLWYRDGKAGYLDDLPLVWRYVREVGGRYQSIQPLVALLERALGERDIRCRRDD
jgi:N-acetylmuramate 1-kinase